MLIFTITQPLYSQYQENEEESFLKGEKDGTEISPPEKESSIVPQELKDKWYFMIGGLFRYIFFPSYLLEPFGDFPDGAKKPFAINPAGGASFIARKNKLDIVASLWWAGYMTNPFLYAENGEADTDPEFIDNSLSLLLITTDFFYTVEIRSWIGFIFGGGLGLGIVLGEIRRTEAIPLRTAINGNYEYEGEGEGDREWVRCKQYNDSGFCELPTGDPDSRGYYNDREGRVPPVVPWLNILIGMRFKPIHHLTIHIEGGFGIGWLTGIRVYYVF